MMVSSGQAGFWQKLLFLLNNTALLCGDDQWQYVEYHVSETITGTTTCSDGGRCTKLLSGSINRDGGPKTIFRLAEAVMAFGFGQYEADGCMVLWSWVRSQVFVSELYPSVSGPEYRKPAVACSPEQAAPENTAA